MTRSPATRAFFQPANLRCATCSGSNISMQVSLDGTVCLIGCADCNSYEEPKDAREAIVESLARRICVLMHGDATCDLEVTLGELPRIGGWLCVGGARTAPLWTKYRPVAESLAEELGPRPIIGAVSKAKGEAPK